MTRDKFSKGRDIKYEIGDTEEGGNTKLVSHNLTPDTCRGCPMHDAGQLQRLGGDFLDADYVVALAGNPNVGKSTVFNSLTGLRQHTGNWPGKTVVRAEGGFMYGDARYKLVDLPGTYSLLSTSIDEQVARDFILFGRPDVTLIVVDATRLERNLNLVLQVLEITDRAVICLNLVDEAARLGLKIDHRRLSRDLGVPVVPAAARQRQGIDELLRAVAEVATGVGEGLGSKVNRVKRSGAAEERRKGRIPLRSPVVARAVSELAGQIVADFPDLPNARWVALRLLDGDESIIQAVRTGEIGSDAEWGKGERQKGRSGEEQIGNEEEGGIAPPPCSAALQIPNTC